MLTAHVAGIGTLGPGFPDWDRARSILRQEAVYDGGWLPASSASRLPATERRRATAVTRMVIDVIGEALSGHDPAHIATVFTSSGGEVEVIHHIFEELAHSSPVLSPMQFHNSVHNTAAGYWGIATSSHAASSSLCAYDDSFGSGLLEAIVHCQVEACPVLLAACDFPPGFPLSVARPLKGPFGAALLLLPEKTSGVIATLKAEFIGGHAESGLDHPELEVLRQNNPAARSLPLLSALANEQSRVLHFGCGLSGSLRVITEPHAE